LEGRGWEWRRVLGCVEKVEVRGFRWTVWKSGAARGGRFVMVWLLEESWGRWHEDDVGPVSTCEFTIVCTGS
jgi:hypothetical protein